MNYQKIYNSLIQKRREQKLTKSDEGENHHIIPKSINADLEKDKSNIIKLTYKEHFIAHRLLVKIYSYDKKLKMKMIYALWRMMHCYNENHFKLCISSAREFERIKRKIVCTISEHQKTIKHKPMSFETKQKLSNLNKGKKLSQEHIDKIINAHIGKPSAMKGKTQSEHAKKLISIASKGNKYALGKIAVNNGIIMKMVYPDKIPIGFKVGALKHKHKMTEKGRQNISKSVKGTRFCTNGIITKRIFANDPLPDGFVYGNCKLRKNKKIIKNSSGENSSLNNLISTITLEKIKNLDK